MRLQRESLFASHPAQEAAPAQALAARASAPHVQAATSSAANVRHGEAIAGDRRRKRELRLRLGLRQYSRLLEDEEVQIRFPDVIFIFVIFSIRKILTRFQICTDK